VVNFLKEITVRVDDNDIERAMRILKKNYEKPSEFRRRKKREALRRQRIAESKRNSRYRRY